MSTDETRPEPVADPAAPVAGPAEPGASAHDAGRTAAERLGRTIGEAAPTEAVTVPTHLIVGIGTGIWALALVLTLVVPSLHAGERSWWPWACVTGIALGAFAWWYTGRGRGNAAGA